MKKKLAKVLSSLIAVALVASLSFIEFKVDDTIDFTFILEDGIKTD